MHPLCQPCRPSIAFARASASQKSVTAASRSPGEVLVLAQETCSGMPGYICTASVSEPDPDFRRDRGEAGSGSLTLAVQMYSDSPENLSWSCTRGEGTGDVCGVR